ncbi:MAG TPA: Asp-tRNA(Asn)/Glu-tRNA(Gln) amidotransferase subunit GatB [Bacteroides sp.]|nr:Asp-tRNA(Asn)/Glu-tRNA(Gln) amidotransferase subunit GatB [Bacteroides sp.]
MQAADKYDVVIGLEVHAQLNTLSKAFSADPNAFGSDPNQNVSVISLGHPGSLPKLNARVVEHAIKLGLAAGSKIAPSVSFARKNYFYTDLPKGYQISQHESPVCDGGNIMIRMKGISKNIRLTRIHIEEDAGKSLHDQMPDASWIDLNRAGVPLLEIVTEPDLNSGEEAQAYLGEIRRLVRYLQICDGNMEEGSLRCDANVSIKKKSETKLGTRTEIKNLNSISNVRKAIEFEVNRQVDILERGENVIQQTVSYDDQRNLTFPLRSKEEADDYRYFPEPDLNPFEIPEDLISRIRSELPSLPNELYRKFTEEFGLGDADAEALIESAPLAGYFEELVNDAKPKTAANWLLGPVKSWMNENNSGIEEFPLSPAKLQSLIKLTTDELVSYTAAQQKLLPALLLNPDLDPGSLAEGMDLLKETGEDIILNQVKEALDKYPEKVQEYHRGKKGLLGLFMGEVMKLSGGKADPAIANKMILEELLNRKQ